jgi:hypothetical protein
MCQRLAPVPSLDTAEPSRFSVRPDGHEEQSAMLTIEARATGRRRDVIPQWQLPVDDLVPGGSPLTLREFIERVVRAEVAAFAERQAERRLVHFLSEQQIDEQAARGRVDFGGRDLDQQADVEESVGVALESFEDGVYLVLIDGYQHESLDEQVNVGTDSHVTFLRLVPLAGG